MNQDFRDMFSTRGAYVDNDGTAPGDNLYGAPDPGFTSSEYRQAESKQRAPQSARVPSPVQQRAFDWRWLWWSIAIGVALAVAIIAWSLR